MRRVKNSELVGETIGELTIVDYFKKQSKNRSYSYFKAICSCCGEEIETRCDSVKSGDTKSCGAKLRKAIRSKVLPSSKVIGESPIRQGKHYFWLMMCNCGETFLTRQDTLKNTKDLNCGCDPGIYKRTHGMTGTLTYRIWRAMKKRCYREDDKDYKNYGGRGIKVCDRWLNSFENFLNDMGQCPEDDQNKNFYSLDREDPDGDYEPSNCRWVSFKEQQRNKNNNKRITIGNETNTQSEWAEIFNVSDQTICNWHKKGVLADKYSQLFTT